jgi:hypothetical protein
MQQYCPPSLRPEVHVSDDAGIWFLVTGFELVDDPNPPTFADLDAA